MVIFTLFHFSPWPLLVASYSLQWAHFIAPTTILRGMSILISTNSPFLAATWLVIILLHFYHSLGGNPVFPSGINLSIVQHTIFSSPPLQLHWHDVCVAWGFGRVFLGGLFSLYGVFCCSLWLAGVRE
jgi:hypothetical protein